MLQHKDKLASDLDLQNLFKFKTCVKERATHVATELDSRRPASASPEAPDLVVECTRDSVA